MKDGFETFTGHGRGSSNSMEITILRNGRAISLNETTFQVLGRPERVQLSYNREENKIGIYAVEAQTRQGTPVKRLYTHNGRYHISNIPFARKCGINTISTAKHYPATFIDNMLVIDLNKPTDAPDSEQENVLSGPEANQFSSHKENSFPAKEKLADYTKTAVQGMKKEGAKIEEILIMVVHAFFEEDKQF